MLKPKHLKQLGYIRALRKPDMEIWFNEQVRVLVVYTNQKLRPNIDETLILNASIHWTELMQRVTMHLLHVLDEHDSVMAPHSITASFRQNEEPWRMGHFKPGFEKMLLRDE